MLFRTSQALVLCPENGNTTAFNFLRQTSFVCTEDLLCLLHNLSDWKSLESVAQLLPDYSKEDLSTCIDALIDIGGVVLHGSNEHLDEQKKVEQWEWGVPSAMLHYCEQNRKFVSQRRAEAIQQERASTIPAPDLYKVNNLYDKVTQFTFPIEQGSVLELMSRRRTVRDVKRENICSDVVAKCLFAGLGIVSETSNCVNRLPLSMTPSGGARNPYEAYIYARSVTGLAPGFYHYSAMEHSLGLVSEGRIANPAGLVGDQAWVNDMSAIVFLCADFARTMWKYQDNNAYRVVLIEAGHIGQNIMLAATENGLTACPSAALAHEKIAKHLSLDHELQAPVYALMLGRPKENTSRSDLN